MKRMMRAATWTVVIGSLLATGCGVEAVDDTASPGASVLVDLHGRERRIDHISIVSASEADVSTITVEGHAYVVAIDKEGALSIAGDGRRLDLASGDTGLITEWSSPDEVSEHTLPAIGAEASLDDLRAAVADGTIQPRAAADLDVLLPVGALALEQVDAPAAALENLARFIGARVISSQLVAGAVDTAPEPAWESTSLAPADGGGCCGIAKAGMGGCSACCSNSTTPYCGCGGDGCTCTCN